MNSLYDHERSVRESFDDCPVDRLYVLLEDNVLGQEVSVEDVEGEKHEGLDFSFWVSPKEDNQHTIRTKIFWNPSKISSKIDSGYMWLHGDYKYFPSSGSKHVSAKKIRQAREFCKKYKVLFAAAWEYALECKDVSNYFCGCLTFEELLDKFIKEKTRSVVKDCFSREVKARKYIRDESEKVKLLEDIVRKNNLFNLYETNGKV
ncbi:MAG: hypothetical protein ACI37J_09050 [Candidatus Bruticola sp.]